MEERDRNEIVHHHGLVCSTISEAASSRKGQVISDPLYSHRAIQESGPESGLSRLPL